MPEDKKLQFNPLSVCVPPGETIKEWAEEHDPEYRILAEYLLEDPAELQALVDGRRELTSDDAEVLEVLTGWPARCWVRLEANYREALKYRGAHGAAARYQNFYPAEPAPHTDMQKAPPQ